MAVTQQSRQIAIETALGPDVLVLNRFTLHEQLNAPFEIEAELSSTNHQVDYDAAIGHPATIRLEIGSQGTRYFCGYISRLIQTGSTGDVARYRATLVPWLWFLGRTSDCRIFQRKSAIEIAEDVFNGHRFGAEFFQPRLQGAVPKRRYCVQYRETDFNFINRLLESEGIYYWFEHKKDDHKLILADGIGGSHPATGFETLEYHATTEYNAEANDAITEWLADKQVQTVHYTLKDFDFKKPSDPLDAEHEIPRKHGMARFAHYDYPGEYYQSYDGVRYTKLRLEELQAGYEVVSAVTTARGLAAGNVVTVANHPRKDQNRKYLLTHLSLTADAGEFASGGTGDQFFSCSFRAIPADTPYRPARKTPKPIVQGIQTATVVGPSGEEIFTDEHARVKVRFHWDRDDEISDDDRTCFIRVSHPWAGKGWGAIATPRIGQEVIVEFLEGDPDRPVITGRVYNGEQVPPYEHPANKTQSGVKSRSSKGGGEANFNEIRFEDKTGSEQVYIHAEKNQDNVVENDETTFVGHDRTEEVGNDETITIGHDRTEKVGNNETITIGVDRTEKVGSNEKITIGVNRTEQVGSNENITIGANRTESVGANETITVASNRTRNVGGNEMVNVAIARTHTVGAAEAVTIGAAQANTIGADQVNTIGANQANTVAASQSNNIGADQSSSIGGSRTTSIGKDDALSVGKKLTIDAGDQIVIKTGKASIVMKKDGTIQIKGKDITINGSGKIDVKASKDVVIKGKKILEN